MKKRDFLSLWDLSRSELLALLDRAIKLKADKRARTMEETLHGHSLVMIFEKASTRTRTSFEIGMFELGGHAVNLSGEGSQLGRGESIADTARVLSGYASAILIRTAGHDRVEELARHASIPVINGLSDLLHPCQLLADLQTVLELRKSLEGLKIAWVGDGNNMTHSWIYAAAILGFDLQLACPAGYQPDAAVVEKAQEHMRKTKAGSLLLTSDPAEAVSGCDFVNTDTWASMGQEEEATQRKKDFAGYCVDDRLLSQANPGAFVLHCLPAYRGSEISASVMDGPQSAIWQQAENRLHAQKALLEAIVRP